MALSGRGRRNKGADFERRLVNLFRAIGVDASRVPLSGMGHEKRENAEFAGDIVMPWLQRREKFEAKKRAGGEGFVTLYNWLAKHKGLFIAADRKPVLVVLRMDDFMDLYRAAHSADKKWDTLPKIEEAQ